MSVQAVVRVVQLPHPCKIMSAKRRPNDPEPTPLEIKHFPGFTVLLSGSSQVRLRLSPKGKTKLPEGAKAIGVSLPADSRLCEVRWRYHRGEHCEYFARTPQECFMIFHPDFRVAFNFGEQLTEVSSLGMSGMTELVHHGRRAAIELRRNKGGQTLDGLEIRVMAPGAMQDLVRDLCPGVDFDRSKREVTRSEIVEPGVGPARNESSLVEMTTSTVLTLPIDARVVRSAPRGYPEDTFLFLRVGEEMLACARMSRDGAPKFYGVLPLNGLLDGFKALETGRA